MDAHSNENVKLFLAPMEGVTDWAMRDLLTRTPGVFRCTTEFVRVTDKLLPDKVFFHYAPELFKVGVENAENLNRSETYSQTPSRVPVFVQLLGGQAEPLLENALRLVELGAAGIDFNFGCPAKTVNRHDGGAALLRFPERIHEICRLARKFVPAHIPVTAKIRLGFDDPSMCFENVAAVETAGLSTLTVHCRTKTDMYKPPAKWEWIARIKERSSIEIVANGDIFSVEDFVRCREITGCSSFMIGRGALMNPLLFSEIQAHVSFDKNSFKEFTADSSANELLKWERCLSHLISLHDLHEDSESPVFATAKSKQWLCQMSKSSTLANDSFELIKRETDPFVFRKMLGSFQSKSR